MNTSNFRYSFFVKQMAPRADIEISSLDTTNFLAHVPIQCETQINFLALLINVFTGDGVRVQSHKRGFGF